MMEVLIFIVFRKSKVLIDSITSDVPKVKKCPMTPNTFSLLSLRRR